MVNLRHGMEPVFQNYGASLAELFAVYWNGTLTTTWSAIGPLSDKFPKPVGTAIWALLAAAVLMHYKGGLRCRKKEIALTGGLLRAVCPYGVQCISLQGNRQDDSGIWKPFRKNPVPVPAPYPCGTFRKSARRVCHHGDTA